MDKNIGEVLKTTTFVDATDNNALEFIDPDIAPTSAEDIVICNKIFSIAVWMLLAMEAEPEHISPCELIRPEKIKRGRVVKEELWSPNFVGRSYVWDREPQGGTHASPRMHRRRGHWTHQPFGPGRTQRKLIRIAPCWVNMKKEES